MAMPSQGCCLSEEMTYTWFQKLEIHFYDIHWKGMDQTDTPCKKPSCTAGLLVAILLVLKEQKHHKQNRGSK